MVGQHTPTGFYCILLNSTHCLHTLIIMACKGLCDRDKYKDVVRSGLGNARAYIKGFRRCGQCEKFIKTQTKFCFCCNSTLRTRPNNTHAKQAFKEAMRIRALEKEEEVKCPTVITTTNQ